MKTYETLFKAADHIRRFGWCQGHDLDHPEERETSAACTIGAISLYVESEAEYRVARAAVVAYIQNEIRDSRDFALSEWNDRPENDAHQVFETLRGAAKVAMIRESGNLLSLPAQRVR